MKINDLILMKGKTVYRAIIVTGDRHKDIKAYVQSGEVLRVFTDGSVEIKTEIGEIIVPGEDVETTPASAKILMEGRIIRAITEAGVL